MGGNSHCAKKIELFAVCKGKLLYAINGHLNIQDESSIKVNSKVIITAVTPSFKLVCIGTQDKQIIIYKVNENENNNPEQVTKHVIPKRPTNILFTDDERYIIVSDAFGDVYKLAVNSSISNTDDDENIVLGHFSSITRMCFMNVDDDRNSKYIVTSDRDSRIRISNYPFCYAIQSFCLGHSDVITALVPLDSSRLLSGSGDGTLRIWNIMTGDCISVIDVRRSSVELGTETTTITEICKVDVNAVVFCVADCNILFSLSLLSCTISVVTRFDHCISGLCVDDTKKIWVCTKGNTPSIHWIELCGSKETRRGSVGVEGVICKEDENGDQEKSVPEGRFEWLLKQRKKVMVEDWKGKKRRHLEI